MDTLRLVLLYGYVMRSPKNVRVVSVFGKNQFIFGSKSAFCSNKSILKIDFLKIDFLFLCLRDDLKKISGERDRTFKDKARLYKTRRASRSGETNGTKEERERERERKCDIIHTIVRERRRRRRKDNFFLRL